MCLFLYKKLEILKQKVHIGKILKSAVDKTGLSIDVVTKRAGYKRGTYYLHIKKENLDTAILQTYGKAIGHDFSEDVEGLTESNFLDAIEVYDTEPATISEAKRQRDVWREKYYALLERYVRSMEKGKQ